MGHDVDLIDVVMPMGSNEDISLYEFDKEEWWDVLQEACKSLGGQISREEFEVSWDEFCELKSRKAYN